MEPDFITISGAREHNLKDVSLAIPKKKLDVFTGVSGSGKSSIAFDTLYAEGQRRYVESLSTYARQFLGQMEKPKYDSIRGLSPTISIEQKAASSNPRSTVGTITEISDYLRVLFARVGTQHCPQCGRPVERSSADQIVRRLERLQAGTRYMVLAPVIENRKGEFREILESLRREGLVRVRVDGQVKELQGLDALDKRKKHQVEAVVDRLVAGQSDARRLTDSVETALRLGRGKLVVSTVAGGGGGESVPAAAQGDSIYSERLACEPCGLSFPELSPQRFSFNSPLGMGVVCNGLGTKLEMDPDLLVPDRTKSIRDGAVVPWASRADRGEGWGYDVIEGLARAYAIDLDRPWKDLSEAQRRVILHGTGERKITVRWNHGDGKSHGQFQMHYEGLIPSYRRRFLQTQSEEMKAYYAKFLTARPCDRCGGARLREESRHVRVGGKTIVEMHALTVEELARLLADLPLRGNEAVIAAELLKEIRSRLRFLLDVGLGYLSLERNGPSLSGGESQRIRLASQIGSELTGVVYVLDEPSIGLHQRDNAQLLATLKHLRDIGNTVIVVEHDLETIRAADYIVDFGPGAGITGGEIVGAGAPADVARSPRSLTGDYLAGRRRIEVPVTRRRPSGKWIEVLGAAANNLRGVDIRFPLGVLTCVTGVSGAGKSSLVNHILYPALARHFYGSSEEVPGKHEAVRGLEHLDKVIAIDQKPIGRTPRSNPATYTKVYDHIRDFYARLPQSKMYGYAPGRFSFNVRGGRCETCQGDGLIKIEMHFLADIYVTCEECQGRRFNEATLQVRYKGKSIAEVLDMTVREAMDFFCDHPSIRRILQTLLDVGLDYMHLGQSSTTLSGGEAQRVKLSRELAKRATGRTLYILDEPSTGLHLEDVRRLLLVLDRLVEAGNTVLVIEHNLEIVKVADYVVDLGPEGGDRGGELVAEGTPEEVARVDRSYTGRFLRQVLGADAERGGVERTTWTVRTLSAAAGAPPR